MDDKDKVKERRRAAKEKRVHSQARSKGRTAHVGFWMIILLLLVAVFMLGFAVRSSSTVMSWLGISSSPTDSTTLSASSKGKSTYDSISMRLSEAEDMLSAYSLDTVQLDQATTLLLDGLMESTGDPYAEYFNEERYKTYVAENSDPKSPGIGVLFADYDGRAYAMDILEGSDAQSKGVQQGDFIIAIDGDRSHKWSAAEVIATLSQHEGESVVITWMRPVSLDATRGEEFTTTIKSASFTEVNVDSYMVDEVGYIRLHQITSNSAELVENAVADLSAQGAKAFLLDITDNPGGFLTQALDIASLFVPSGVLVNIETNEGTSSRNAAGTTSTSAPLVVLVNEYTSGVAEVLACALQDNQRATTVGQTTVGKGSVQVVRELSFGGALRYTAAYYLTPLGQPINDVGIVPDVEVPNETDDATDENKSLTVAMEIARSLITS